MKRMCDHNSCQNAPEASAGSVAEAANDRLVAEISDALQVPCFQPGQRGKLQNLDGLHDAIQRRPDDVLSSPRSDGDALSHRTADDMARRGGSDHSGNSPSSKAKLRTEIALGPNRARQRLREKRKLSKAGQDMRRVRVRWRGALHDAAIVFRGLFWVWGSSS